MDFEEIEDIVEFYHDVASEKNRKKRRNSALKWRKDRKQANRYVFVDRKYAKRRLHKSNRKILELSASDYYKTADSLYDVCFGLT